MKFTKAQKMVVAALFARSNMGQKSPEPERVARLFAHPVTHLDTPVVALCEEFMESDDHYDMFMVEARWWLRDKKLNSLDSIRAVWPDMAAVIEAGIVQ